MTGPEHFRRAEELAAKAAEYLGRGDGQDTAAVWAAVAQVHATLALAAAAGKGVSHGERPGPLPAAPPIPRPPAPGPLPPGAPLPVTADRQPPNAPGRLPKR